MFLIPATLVFHNPVVDSTQMIPFMKNLAIIGGLLMVVAYGAGAVSLDRWVSSAANGVDDSVVSEEITH